MNTRLRRLRVNDRIRRLVQETQVNKGDLIYPIFVVEGENLKNPIAAMPGIYQYSIDRLEEELGRVQAAGVPGVLLFGIPVHKDERGSEAYNEEGVTQRAIRLIRKICPRLLVIADVCLCEYTSHGHCGLVRDGEVLNDETLPLLAKTAVSYARAGADIVAPSDMMDGHTAVIREELDRAGFENTLIMAYSAKFASAYYGPFREAAHSAPQFGDRRTYQMAPGSRKEAMREIREDIEQGADIVMVKPGLPYLDILREAADRFELPLAVYHVSGEYAMVKAAAANGWIDEKRIVLENLTAIKRAGAKIIITYHALEAAGWLEEETRVAEEKKETVETE